MSRLKTDAIRNVNASVDGITLDTSGKVSIGNESSPLGTLHVKEGDSGVTSADTSQDTLFLESNGNAGITIATPIANTGYLTFADPDDSNIGQIIYRHGGTNANSMGFFVNANERLHITSTGQVRLNTAGAPAADLHVGGTGAALNAYFQTSRSSGAYHHYAIGNSGASLGYIGSAGQISASGGGTSFAVRSEGDLQFCAGGGTERLRIKSGGTVAIPAQGSSNANPRLLFESAVDANDFSFSQYEDGNGTYTLIGQNLQLNSGGNTTVLDSGHKTAGLLFDGRNNGSLIFYTGGTNAQSERLRITSAGKIHSLNAVQSGGNTTGGFQFNAVDTACVLGIQQPSSGSDANAAIQVWDGSSNNLRINYSGLIKTSEGIDFSGAQTNTAGMTSETLDGYEEGTWTPAFNGYGGTAGSFTYSGTNNGKYTKIGNQVTIWFYAAITNMATLPGGTYLTLNSLPFTNGGGTGVAEGASVVINWWDPIGAGLGEGHNLVGFVQNNTTRIIFGEQTEIGIGGFSPTQFFGSSTGANGSYMYGFATYIV